MAGSLHITIHGAWSEWAIAAATLLLALATSALVWVAWRARDELKIAVARLEQVKKDRHVAVFSEMGRRWDEMVESLTLQAVMSREQILELFQTSVEPTRNPVRFVRRRQVARRQVMLLRIPNYFEDAAIMEQAGGLDRVLFEDNFGGLAVDSWKKWEPTIKAFQDGDDLSWVRFEELAKRVMASDAARLAEEATSAVTKAR